MNIFVTGGAGFIGSYMVDKLIDKHEVSVFDNLSTGSLSFIKKHMDTKNFHFIKGDIKDLNTLKRSMSNMDLVIHLAANPDVRLGVKDSSIDLKEGIIGTYNVVEAMRLNSINNIIFSSSSVVYGDAKILPTPENYGPLMPISIYGASKLSAESLISAFVGSFGMKAWIYRFANVIGERSTHGVIFDFIKKLHRDNKELEVLGNGKQRKSYILAEDCVDAMLFGYEHRSNSINLFNIGAEDQISVSKISEIVIEAVKCNAGIRYTGTERGWPGDVINQHLDIKKLKELGWRPRYSSEEAVRITAKKIAELYNE
ncbi:MAG: NAD-dependent epimerase/dehydratase family protein [Candidatus Thermoplasmatota archaeon]|jgi:UDP-glucose 4-epimerase|nr:NAD-dependent epimerase/dehydratase family protein [Candidatus Thermoplasmatota archaeon]MCL5962833.1 NAD-dependent epimerase/dehydratase family protein [Candidatus Thermoplasmatota archaeon]